MPEKENRAIPTISVKEFYRRLRPTGIRIFHNDGKPVSPYSIADKEAIQESIRAFYRHLDETGICRVPTPARSNADEEETWITVNGARVKIEDGQSKNEAVKSFTEKKEAEREAEQESAKKESEIKEFGTAYREYTGKPNEAIEHLLNEQNGYVPAAIHKEDVGDIDFVWGKGGNDGYGLAHIIERREKQNIDGKAFVRQIPGIIENGEVIQGKRPGRVFISDDKSTALVRLDYDGKKATWLVTAYISE